jgi:hypothetical protein
MNEKHELTIGAKKSAVLIRQCLLRKKPHFAFSGVEVRWKRSGSMAGSERSAPLPDIIAGLNCLPSHAPQICPPGNTTHYGNAIASTSRRTLSTSRSPLQAREAANVPIRPTNP